LTATASSKSTTRPICSPSTSSPAARSGNTSSAPFNAPRPSFADGKLYVGTENGKFFILKPHNDRVETLSEVTFPQSTSATGD
jgi:hypothetical protein